MAKLERYGSFEEMENSTPTPAKQNFKKASKQKAFKEFGELLRQNMRKPAKTKK